MSAPAPAAVRTVLAPIIVLAGTAWAAVSEDPAWILNGELHDQDFGYSVATAGDVNGDGYDDVVVGVPYYPDVYNEENEGRVLVYHGSPSGPSTTPDWIAEGNEWYIHFGRSVATAGDVNGDG